jgi:hypothetical protein
MSPRRKMLLLWALALCWPLPALLRVSEVSLGARLGLLACGAFTALPILSSQRGAAASPRGVAVLWALLLAAAPLTVLGGVLHATTHHRPLGAVTFALLGAGAIAGAILLVRRCQRSSLPVWHGCRIAAALSGLSTLWQVRALPAPYGGSLVDALWGVALIAGVIALSAAGRPLAMALSQRAVITMGVLWLSVGLAGVVLVSSELPTLLARAPLVVGLLAW